jgi:hypothetical protein
MAMVILNKHLLQMIKVVVLTCNGQKQHKELSTDRLLAELQSIIGGYIDAIPINPDSSIQAYCHDEGLIQRLPMNQYAVTILKQLGFDLSYTLNCLFDPVVLIGPDDTSLSASALKKINQV